MVLGACDMFVFLLLVHNILQFFIFKIIIYLQNLPSLYREMVPTSLLSHMLWNYCDNP